MKNLTGITVTCNCKALLERAYKSIRVFHPDMPLMIVDGSDKQNSCHDYVKNLPYSDPLVSIRCFDYNIGHGLGMDFALQRVATEYALIFDSDIEMKKSPIDGMLAEFDEDTYGVGYIERTGLDGYEYGAHKHHKNEPEMRYLHPYFAIISVARYKEFWPFVHHGAPCYLAMLDIHKKGLSDKIIKEYPGLGHTAGKGWNWIGNPNLGYVRHDTRGTRDILLAQKRPEIEPGWTLNRGLV